MVDLNKILGVALTLIQQYKQGRDAIKAKGDPTDAVTGALKSDAELIALLKEDGAGLTATIDELITKHSGPAIGTGEQGQG